MARVLGLGGLFFKTADGDALRDWYRRVLGLDVTGWGGVIFPPLARGVTVWSPFGPDSEKFAPSEQPYMVNFVVDDLDAMLERVRGEGVEVLGREDAEGHGAFAWIMDPSGVKIELWEPAADPAAED